MSALVRFEDLTLGYDGRPVVERLSGVVEAGGMLAVAGPNGGGKSTFMKALAGRLKPMAGRLSFDHVHRKDIAYLPQAAGIDRSIPLSMFDLVSAGAWRSSGIFGGLGRKRNDAVHAALAAVGLAGHENAQIGALSGGQLQRALFARLMVQEARLILLDEPFTAVDEATVADLTGLVRRWHGEGRTIIAVLHDLDLIRSVFPETLLLARGEIARGTSIACLTEENLRRARRACDARPRTVAA
ncbi:MAG: metal ABC transporter ATP-binding protein [Beijerinckiaceae bacterium]